MALALQVSGQSHKQDNTLSEITKPTLKDIALLLGIAVIWGSAFSSIKVLVAETGALWGAALRVFVGFLVVLPFLLLVKKGNKLDQRQIIGIAFVSLLNMVIPFILISWALKHIDAGVGSLLLGVTPFIAMIIGHFTTRDERITKWRALAVLFAMTGISILVGPQAFLGLGSSAFLAQLAIVASGACYVIAGFMMRRIDAEPVLFTVSALGAGAVMLIAVALVGAGAPFFQLSGKAWVNLLWLGTAPTGLAYLMRYWLVRRLGVSTFALAMNAVPIFGISIGALYLGEVIHWTTLLALAFVLCGLAIARKAAPKPA